MEAKLVVAALGALAQGTRLEIFRRLVVAGAAGLSVGQIAEHLDVAPATMSFHLKELLHANLILARQEGRYIFYCANYPTMNELLSFLTENCCAGDGTTRTKPACSSDATGRATSRGKRPAAGKGAAAKRLRTVRSRAP